MRLLFVLVITSYCGKKKMPDSLSSINIEDNFKNMQKIYMSQFCENIQYIPLEANKQHPLSWNTSIRADFTEEFILESNGRQCILYDDKGKYLRQIGEQGRGPGEYTLILNVWIKNEKIYIRDYYDLIEYQMDGTFQKRYKNIFYVNEKYLMEETIFLNDTMVFGNIENRTGHEQLKALIINKSGEIKYTYKNYVMFNLGSGVSRAKSPGKAIMFKFKDKFFFKEFLNDTLFQMDDKYQLNPVYIFNFGKYKESLHERGMSWFQIDLSSYIDLDHIFQIQNHLILICAYNNNFPAKRKTPEELNLPGLEGITLWYNTTAVLGIFDKRKENLVFSLPTSTDIHLNTSGLYNDIDAGPRFLPGKLINDTTMVMKINFSHLLEYIQSDEFKSNNPKYPEKKKKLMSLVDSLKKTDFDNPIYMCVTFKSE